jgi:hypothetical protein
MKESIEIKDVLKQLNQWKDDYGVGMQALALVNILTPQVIIDENMQAEVEIMELNITGFLNSLFMEEGEEVGPFRVEMDPRTGEVHCFALNITEDEEKIN